MGSVAKPLSLSFACLLAACSSPEEMGRDVGVERSASATPADESALDRLERRTARGAKPSNFSDDAKDGEAAREFDYSWPAAVSAIPPLVTQLSRDRDEALAQQKTEWREARAEFGSSDCVSCVNRGYETTWEVVADLPRFLSLSATRWVYSGGAHGNIYYSTLVWDRQADAAIEPVDLFKSSGALFAAVRDRYCEALDRQRAEKRGDFSGNAGIFSECPALEELTVLVGSSNGETFDRIGLIAAPYVAGAYAEGTYEVTLPVDAEVLGAVSPEYRESFSARE
ncbi:hypothetical protein [Erythrobacter sp.]|uniref:hypothetical protein n=1 Tax=Erythrobacter sp. TaxID=1042 RepID=UPI003C73E7E3